MATVSSPRDRSVKKRVLEHLAIFHHMFIWLAMPILSLILPVYLLYTRFWWLVLLYVVWFVYDFKTPRVGSRKSVGPFPHSLFLCDLTNSLPLLGLSSTSGCVAPLR
jgi:hypothetical protein